MNTSTGAILLYSLIVAVLLIYLPYIVVGAARVQVGYDMKAPRNMFEKLPPYAQRATWAHQNAFESVIVYTPAALSAYVVGVDSIVALGAVIAYLIARTLYPIFYIADIALARSLMFAVANLSSFTLFALTFLKVNSL
ncbi:MAG: MAPEG family protein [Gomphosphaeria aponina SAG 52.96 = DSM 107014]|uniref:MAPEG family protein n=1 Tax=Gomphosphaeria aponina SAG 52.96 = DSM 107014 TaxID=1521640 RepID=A0A941GVJ0_9CHRO|nr:MAPEG family protein [Gomphosphaeria aponina SAG 52.96 = DSM 107014]